MPPTTSGAGGAAPSAPSMLDLIRLSPRLLFPPGGVDLYRQIAILAELTEGQEVLDVASGRGIPLEYFVREYGVQGAGVEEDARLVAEAEERAREHELSARLQFQSGRGDSLPYRDHVFDVAVGELGLAAHCDPADAVSELVRVVKPGGTVALVQLVWKSAVDEARRSLLSLHLGTRPMMLVEWKRLLRDAGVVDLHTEDWSAEETTFRPRIAKPFPDFAEVFSLGEKLAILRKAWSRWGLRGVRSVLEREGEVHRLLTHERILGLVMMKGRKERVAEPSPEDSSAGEGTAHVDQPPSAPAPGPDGADARPDTADVAHDAGDDSGESHPTDDGRESADTAGLPLFGGSDET